MLLQLTIRNFQRHQGLELNFSRIASIRGPTDSGKSSILRALRWLCLNDMAGDDFIREGSKQTEVTLTLKKGGQQHTIKRTRGSSGNGYELDRKEFKAFGNSVPQDIASLLNLSEINFQSQHDPPFWFCESAPEVSRKLNAVIDLSVIDSSLSFIANKVRLSQDRKKLIEERLEKAKQELEVLEPQRERIQDFQNIKELNEQLTAAQENRDTLEELLGKARSRRYRLQTAEEQMADGAQVVEFGRTWRKFVVAQEGLADLIGRITRTQTATEEAEEGAKQAEERFHRETKGKDCPLCGKVI